MVSWIISLAEGVIVGGSDFFRLSSVPFFLTPGGASQPLPGFFFAAALPDWWVDAPRGCHETLMPMSDLCPVCGFFCLPGRMTCGQTECRRVARAHARARALAQPPVQQDETSLPEDFLDRFAETLK